MQLNKDQVKEILHKTDDFLPKWSQETFGLTIKQNVVQDNGSYCLLGLCRKAAVEIYGQSVYEIIENHEFDLTMETYLLPAIKQLEIDKDPYTWYLPMCVIEWNDEKQRTLQDIEQAINTAKQQL